MANAVMNNLEKAVLLQEIGDVSPRLSIRSNTRIDVGYWWWPVRMWLLVLDNELVLLAAGRRRYVGRIPFAQANESRYDHEKGALVIAPCEDLQTKELSMKTSEAIRVLRLLGLKP